MFFVKKIVPARAVSYISRRYSISHHIGILSHTVFFWPRATQYSLQMVLHPRSVRVRLVSRLLTLLAMRWTGHVKLIVGQKARSPPCSASRSIRTNRSPSFGKYGAIRHSAAAFVLFSFFARANEVHDKACCSSRNNFVHRATVRTKTGASLQRSVREASKPIPPDTEDNTCGCVSVSLGWVK